MALYRSCVPSIDEKVQAIMLERTRYPAGVPCWVDTAQRDPRAAVAFYGGLFGWEFEDSMPPDSPVRYLLARLRGRDVAAVGSATDLGPPTPVWNTYISVESADETATRVTRADGQVINPPFDILEAGRMAVFADPAGATFCVWQPGEHKGAQLVNTPQHLELVRSQHSRHRRREGVLWRGLRLGDQPCRFRLR